MNEMEPGGFCAYTGIVPPQMRAAELILSAALVLYTTDHLFCSALAQADCFVVLREIQEAGFLLIHRSV